MSLACGFLPLVYGNFLIVLPTLLLADLIASRRSGPLAAGVLIIRYGPAAAAFLLPTLAWVALVTWTTGSYYNHEIVVYRQLIWVVDAARLGVGGFLAQAARNTSAYAATFFSLELLPVGAAAILLAVGRARTGRRGATSRAGESDATSDRHQQGCLAVAGCLFVFLWLLGYYRTRLTFSLVPPSLCLAGIELTRLTASRPLARRRLVWVLTSLAGVWCAFHVLKYGPFS